MWELQGLLVRGFEPRVIYLPKIQAEDADVIIVADGGVRLVFRIVYLWVDPLPLVIGIVNDPRFPLSLHREPTVDMSVTIFHSPNIIQSKSINEFISSVPDS